MILFKRYNNLIPQIPDLKSHIQSDKRKIRNRNWFLFFNFSPVHLAFDMNVQWIVIQVYLYESLLLWREPIVSGQNRLSFKKITFTKWKMAPVNGVKFKTFQFSFCSHFFNGLKHITIHHSKWWKDEKKIRPLPETCIQFDAFQIVLIQWIWLLHSSQTE